MNDYVREIMFLSGRSIANHYISFRQGITAEVAWEYTCDEFKLHDLPDLDGARAAFIGAFKQRWYENAEQERVEAEIHARIVAHDEQERDR